MTIKSLLLQSIEDLLKRQLVNEVPSTSIIVALEAKLRETAEYIRELERDASKALEVEHLKRVNALERMNAENVRRFKKREKEWTSMAIDLRRRINELYDKLPLEERMKQDFTCFSCDKIWNLEFLVMTDKQNNKFCWSCVNEGTEKAGKETDQEIIIEATPFSSPIKVFQCEFCGLDSYGKPIKVHITNAPDGRSSRDIIKLCENCSLNKAAVDPTINYCPRRTRPRDSYDGSEYDCNCEPKEKYWSNY